MKTPDGKTVLSPGFLCNRMGGDLWFTWGSSGGGGGICFGGPGSDENLLSPTWYSAIQTVGTLLPELAKEELIPEENLISPVD